ncbi:unnamed protein product [Acanthoscelides obtectus]|uniref:Chromo domain-containing protein n=1 Tax=Acanthoscelides obtectus TaxID=200917 RepID=A0A9P0Q8H7_ACAOB|nr:unnamed protein product [Acanthoscelides obtectus]CAK1664517.1 Chromobox protein homolog 3 [Acanthoscelides obtectus]
MSKRSSPVPPTKTPTAIPASTEPDEYFVERIIDSRVNEKGIKEYYIKWSGYDEKDNSWEPEYNVNSPGLIKAFELEKARKEKEEKKTKLTTQNGPGKGVKRKSDDKKQIGFDRGLEPEKIIGATDSPGELMFLIKWNGTDEADLVPAKQANIRCPQIVIRFYEQRLKWHAPNLEKPSNE